MIAGAFIVFCLMAAAACFLLSLLYAVGKDYHTSALSSILGIFLLVAGVWVAV